MKNSKTINWVTQNFYFLAKQMEILIAKKEEPYSMKFCFAKYSKKHGHEICVTQVLHKNIWPEFTAEEIINNEDLLKQFSPASIVDITIVNERVKKLLQDKKYKIVEFTRLSEKSGDMLLIQELGKKNFRMITCEDVAENRNLLRRFNAEDAYAIGYTNGLNYARIMMAAIKNAKNTFIGNLKKKTMKLFVLK